MSETWRLAFRNLARNRRRNLATMAAIALGFAGLLALGGYTNRTAHFLATHSIYVRQASHLVIYAEDGLEYFASKPKTHSLSPEVQTALRELLDADPRVEFYTPQLLGYGLVGNGCKSLPFIVSAMDPRIDQRLRSHPELLHWTPQFANYSKGKGLWEYPADFGAIAVSDGLARILGKPKVVSDFAEATVSDAPLVLVDCQSPQAGEQIAADANVQMVSASWDGEMMALDGEIAAHYSTGISETNNSSVFTSLTYLQKLYATSNVTLFSIWLKNPKELAAVMSELTAKLQERGLKLDLYPWDDERISPMYTGTLSFLYTMVAFMSFILAVIIFFSVFNATTITIIERAAELGMMRSMGFTHRAIRALYLRETCLLGLASLLIGGLISGIGLWVVNHAGISYNPPGVAGGIELLLIPSVGFVVLAGIGIFCLALLTTFAVLSRVTKRPIPLLLSGAIR